jgi:hypothetical protein
MAVLIAAVVLVGLLGLVNLVFSFGLIRRLREHTEILDKLSQRGSAGVPVALMLEAGGAVTDFDTRTADGERLSRGDLVGTTLVGVFSPGCSACEAQVGQFVDYASTHPGGRSQALAVVVGEETNSAPYVERLEAAARVVRESWNGPVSTALAVRGFPAFALVDGDLVRVSGSEVGALPAAVSG